MKKLVLILLIWVGAAQATETIILFPPTGNPQTCTVYQGGLVVCL
jgi:hypothetical protein